MELDSDVRVARLMDLVDDFSVGLCKLKLQVILRADLNAGDVNACQPTNTIVRSFLRGIASCDKQKLYTELLTVLDRHCAQKVEFLFS
jgi:mediator of RNA polymerase II transcription subunit 12